MAGHLCKTISHLTHIDCACKFNKNPPPGQIFSKKKLQKIRINSKPTPSITSKAYVLKNAVWVPGLRSAEASVLWLPKLLKLPNPLNSNPLPPKNKKIDCLSTTNLN